MYRELTGSIPIRAAQPPGCPSGIASIVAASDGGEAVQWGILPANDQEAGNPCLGIVVGCVLSLPIWLGLAIVSFLLR